MLLKPDLQHNPLQRRSSVLPGCPRPQPDVEGPVERVSQWQQSGRKTFSAPLKKLLVAYLSVNIGDIYIFAHS